MAVSEKHIGRGINATFVSSISPTHTRLREDHWHDRTRVSKAGRERSEVRQENLLTIGVLGAMQVLSNLGLCDDKPLEGARRKVENVVELCK